VYASTFFDQQKLGDYNHCMEPLWFRNNTANQYGPDVATDIERLVVVSDQPDREWEGPPNYYLPLTV
jgi:hypothetical protein